MADGRKKVTPSPAGAKDNPGRGLRALNVRSLTSRQSIHHLPVRCSALLPNRVPSTQRQCPAFVCSDPCSKPCPRPAAGHESQARRDGRDPHGATGRIQQREQLETKREPKQPRWHELAIFCTLSRTIALHVRDCKLYITPLKPVPNPKVGGIASAAIIVHLRGRKLISLLSTTCLDERGPRWLA
jgi:hypothetical protein